MFFATFASTPQLVRATGDIIFNWANVNVASFDISENIYLQRIFYTSDNLNVGIAHNWGAVEDHGDFFVTSEDMINWHIQAPASTLVDMDGRFFGANHHGILHTDLQNTWQLAELPGHVWWPTVRFAGDDVWIFYSYDMQNRAGIRTQDGQNWYDFGANMPEDRQEEDWDRVIWPWDGLYVRDNAYHSLQKFDFVDRGEQFNLSYITLTEGGTPQLVRIFQNGQQVSRDEHVSNWSATATAVASANNIQLDGEAVSLPAFNIEGNNFFRLRDLAYILIGSDRPFDLVWDAENNALDIQSWMNYTPIGGELSPVAAGDVTATLSEVNITVWGNPISITAYNISGYNFFMLRDVAALLHMTVGFDESTNTIQLSTGWY